MCFCEGRKEDMEHQRGQAKSEKGNRDVLNSEAFDWEKQMLWKYNLISHCKHNLIFGPFGNIEGFMF